MNENENGNGNGYQLPEAPASATVKVISPNGFEILFTIRDTDAAMLFRRVQSMVGYLEHSGYTPPPQRGGRSKKTYVQAPADGGAPLCPVHNAPMKASQYGGWYCSRKDDAGNYCSHKSN